LLALPEADQQYLRIYGLDFPESKGFIHEQMLIAVEGTPPGTAYRTGKPVVVEFSELAPFCPQNAPLAEGLQCGCALPLISRNRVLGISRSHSGLAGATG
jgi:hypothetical protein